MERKKGVREKLDRFFGPGPSRDIEDPVDIYGHAGRVLGIESADVDVGERRIRGAPEELDDRVYGGKRVSRRELF